MKNFFSLEGGFWSGLMATFGIWDVLVAQQSLSSGDYWACLFYCGLAAVFFNNFLEARELAAKLKAQKAKEENA